MTYPATWLQSHFAFVSCFCLILSLCPVAQPARLLCPWNSPGQNTGLPFPSPGDLPDTYLKKRFYLFLTIITSLISEALIVKKYLSRCQENTCVGRYKLRRKQALSLLQTEPYPEGQYHIFSYVHLTLDTRYFKIVAKHRVFFFHFPFFPQTVQVDRIYCKSEVSLQKQIPQEVFKRIKNTF